MFSGIRKFCRKLKNSKKQRRYYFWLMILSIPWSCWMEEMAHETFVFWLFLIFTPIIFGWRFPLREAEPEQAVRQGARRPIYNN